jgi:DNA-binding GntR family transcriptional regulator
MNLKEKAAAKLRNAVLKGEYLPGDRLTEIALSKRFRVSRTPIREALRQLEKEGFVKISPSGGARVVKLSMKETLDIYDVLIILEGAACRFAAAQIDETQLDRLEEYNLLFERAMDEKNVELLCDLNASFHWLITEAAKNSYLIDMRTNFRRLIDRIARIFPHVPGQCDETLLWHRKIIDALKARNSALAEFVMREHLGNAKKNLAEFLRQKETCDRGPEGLIIDDTVLLKETVSGRMKKGEYKTPVAR